MLLPHNCSTSILRLLYTGLYVFTYHAFCLIVLFFISRLLYLEFLLFRSLFTGAWYFLAIFFSCCSLCCSELEFGRAYTYCRPPLAFE